MIECNTCGNHINKWDGCPICKIDKIKKFQLQVDKFIKNHKSNKVMK